MDIVNMLMRAAEVALPTNYDNRSFWLGCVGIRDDGAVVVAKNGAVKFSTSIENYQLIPSSHAEGRVIRKLGSNGIVFVARVSKKDHSLSMARCCPMCETRLRSAKVKKVYYTINAEYYGLFNLKEDNDRVFRF